MATVRVLLLLICTIAFNRARVYGGGIIKYYKYNYERSGNSDKLLKIAGKEIGIRETATNSSARIDEYNAYVGVKKVPWCASFVSWCFGRAGFARPRTAWSPALFPAGKLAGEAMPGMVFGVYFASLKRIGHCGLIKEIRGAWYVTIEGNSSADGSREGTGVFSRLRHQRSVANFSDWLN